MAGEDVRINIMGNAAPLNNALNRVSGSFNGLRGVFTGVFNSLQGGFKDLGGAASRKMSDVRKSVDSARGDMQKLEKDTGKASEGFNSWALSMFFFGLMLQQFFNRIWRASTQTFNDISHSVRNNVTEFDKLEGSMTFLKFVAGEALEPIATALIPIIDMISTWINDNPTLFKWAVLILGAFSALFLIVGQIGIAVSSLSAAFGAVVKVGGMIKAGFVAIKAVFAGVSLAVVAKIALIVAAIIGIGAAFWGIFKELKNNWGEILDDLKQMWSLFTGIIVDIFNGDWGDAWDKFKELGALAFKFVARTAIRVLFGALNGFIGLYNMIADKLGMGTIGKINANSIIRKLGLESDNARITSQSANSNPLGTMSQNVNNVINNGDTVINVDRSMSGTTEWQEMMLQLRRSS